LPDNHIRALAIDGSNIWIGTYYGGLAEFDGTNWTVYNTSNSDLPDNEVLALAIDGSDNIWIGIWGLAKFDGTNWTVYNTSNSGLPYNRVMALAIDGSDNIWIGTNGGGLAKFDGTNWTVYKRSNSYLPDDCIISLAIDGSNIWIGTYGGLAKFDGSNWAGYFTSNSGLPDNWVHALAIDASNIWIGTWLGGLAVYTDTGKQGTEYPTTTDDEEAGKKGGCFIATAAYGSPLHPYVRIIRDFRDKYLMPSKLGRVLVNIYYKYSPFVANIIAKHKVLKIAVQINLMPLVVFGYSMVHFGPIITSVILVFIFMLPLFLISFLRKRITKRLKNYDS
jgi:ligand-binding sensor domain-containing protein